MKRVGGIIEKIGKKNEKPGEKHAWRAAITYQNIHLTSYIKSRYEKTGKKKKNQTMHNEVWKQTLLKVDLQAEQVSKNIF